MTRTTRVLAVSVIGGLGGPVVSLLTMLGSSQHSYVVVGPFTTSVARRLTALPQVREVLPLPRPRGRAALVLPLVVLAVLRAALPRRQAFDVFLANGLTEAAVTAPSALLLRKRLVVWVHNSELPFAARLLGAVLRSRFLRVEWRAVSHLAGQVCAPVRGRRDYALVFNPLDERAVVALERRVGPTFSVAFLGSARPHKGFDLLPAIIDATAAAGVQDVRWLVHAGRGADLGVDAQLDRRPHVERPGHVFPQSRAFETADVVLCPSRIESFGRVVAEAMLNGLPVVASDIPAFRELLGHEPEALFPPEDAAAAGARIAELARDPQLRRRSGEENRARADRYLTERVVPDFDAALETVPGS